MIFWLRAINKVHFTNLRLLFTKMYLFQNKFL